MPTKSISPLVLDSVGVFGLNTQANASSLDHRWLVKADNIMINSEGRLTSRKGIRQVSASVGNYPVKSLHAHKKSDGSTLIVGSANNTIYEMETTGTPLTMTAQTFSGTPQTISADDWQWIQYDEDSVAVQAGHKPIHYTSSTDTWTDLEDTASYAAPTGITTFDPSCILAKYGRLWAAGMSEDKETVLYSRTLAHHEWNGVGSGSINMRSVWGFDEIVSLSSFNGKLIIFGKQNIAIYNDPSDPSAGSFGLDEVIHGIGCVARDSVQAFGDDILFLSSDGVRSLNRTKIQDKMPLTDLTKNVKNDIIKNITASSTGSVKAQYNHAGGYYILSFTDLNETYILDFKAINPDGTPRITKWNTDAIRAPKSFLSLPSGTLYLGLGSSTSSHTFNGVIAKYDDYYDLDYSGSTPSNQTYQTVFKTVWMDFGNPYTAKLLKKFSVVIDGGREQDVTVKWFRDYNGTIGDSSTFSLTPVSSGVTALFGDSTSLYGNVKYAPLFFPKEYRLNLSKAAKVVQIEMINLIKGFKGSLQSMTVLAKEGKIR
jgi:hypothetical protein